MKNFKIFFNISVASFLLLSISGVIPKSKKGFSCNDDSIRYPYLGDTITPIQLFTILLFFPTTVIILNELNYPSTQRVIKSSIKYYLIGFLYVYAITEVLKHYVTGLRPHFLHTCMPEWSKINCSISNTISQFICTGSSHLVHSDIYKSFPSGHSSLSCFALVFLKKYCKRIKINHLYWLIFLSFLLWTLGCCITRIYDHRHHWWDVVGGMSLGIITGWFMDKIKENTSEKSLKF
ncbi:phospholipid phosphatase 1-like [Centruroides vittatus]|uniref:phospholipid phosphatase 1-like n=1 Tax=Centruroides vittatus TaxID=120091 RepID=UPI0035106F32